MNTDTNSIGVVTPKNFPSYARATGAPHQAVEKAIDLVHSFSWKRDYIPTMKEAKERMEKARNGEARALWWQVWTLASKEHNAAKIRRKKAERDERVSRSPLAAALVKANLVH